MTDKRPAYKCKPGNRFESSLDADGKEHGVQTEYHPDGRLCWQYHMNHGVRCKQSRVYHYLLPQLLTWERTYSEGGRPLMERAWHSNGVLNSERNYVTGSRRFWDEQGRALVAVELEGGGGLLTLCSADG